MYSEWQAISVEVVDPFTDPALPRAFTWEGAWLRVTDLGRWWQAEDGTHRLVRVLDGRTFELVLEPGPPLARLVSAPPAAV